MISTMTITETRKKITSLENTMDYDDAISITNLRNSKFPIRPLHNRDIII